MQHHEVKIKMTKHTNSTCTTVITNPVFPPADPVDCESPGRARFVSPGSELQAPTAPLLRPAAVRPAQPAAVLVPLERSVSGTLTIPLCAPSAPQHVLDRKQRRRHG